MTAYESRTIEVDGRNVDVLEGGEGPTLVFLHGGGGRVVWPFHEKLTESFRVVMIEQPGFGGTPEITEGLDEKAYAEGVLSWVSAAVSGDYHLGGHSFGGRIAAWLAVLAPEKTQSLTLLAPGVVVPDGLVVPPPPLPEGTEPTEQQKKALALVQRLVFGRSAELEAGLAALTVPVTIALGSADPLFPGSLSPEYTAALPNANVEIVEGGNHVFALLMPEETLALVQTTTGVSASA